MNELAIQIAWSVGLVGALVPTVVILKQVALILRELRHIHELAGITLEAAKGIRANVAVGSELRELAPPAGQIRQATETLAITSAEIRSKLVALGGR